MRNFSEIKIEHEKQIEAVANLEDVIKNIFINHEIDTIHEEAARIGCCAEEIVTAQKYSGCLFMGVL